MPHVETSIEIWAPVERVYRVACNMEEYPKFMENVLSVKVVEREANQTITQWEAMVDGRPFRWQERDIFDEEGLRIRYQQVSGDLKKFEGEWIFEAIPGGTRVVLTVDFDLGIPMFSTMLHPYLTRVVRKNCEDMLKGMKNMLENEGASKG